MADQKRWFKLWESATSDDKIISLPPALRWAWAALGAHTKVHGDNGTLTVSRNNGVLEEKMGIEKGTLFDVIKLLPNIDMEMHNPDNGEATVIWKKWSKYQEDSTTYDRLKRWRKRHHDNGDKRRGEEKRREEKKKREEIPPKSPQGMSDAFSSFWLSYPNKKKRPDAWKAWRQMRIEEEGLVVIVMAALEKQKHWKQWTKDGGEFIPYPASWLRAEGWTDQEPKPEPEEDDLYAYKKNFFKGKEHDDGRV